MIHRGNMGGGSNLRLSVRCMAGAETVAVVVVERHGNKIGKSFLNQGRVSVRILRRDADARR